MFRISNLRSTSGVMALILAMGGMAPPVEARNRKSEKLFKQGRVLEDKKDYDGALEYYEQALASDPSDAGYRIVVQRTRFYASQKHLNEGQKLRDQGNLDQALAQFMRAIQLDPSSSMAIQEWKRTQEMIEREKSGVNKPGEKGMTPAQIAMKESEERIGSLLAPPELKPVNRVIQSLKMNSQPPRVLYETLCKLAGLNVVFDPQYQNTSGRQNYNVELNNSTVENALDYLGVLTKTFWKPLTENTVFVAEDNVTKRRDYDDDVVKVFYVTNSTSVQEFQEIATAVRSLTEIRRVYTYNAQKALLIRGTVDQVALAEKLIRDLDKPKAEVVVDLIVMEANRGRTRDLASTIMSGSTAGLKLPVTFSPRSSLSTGSSTDTTTTSSNIRLSNIGKVDVRDFTTSLPGALLSAILTDRSTRVLQSPQVRASDGQKVSLRIGDKIPIATGSFQPGIGGVGAGVSPLVSTQFNFTEVGVNVDMTPQVHGSEEVTLKISVEVSTVRDRVDLGGISQPVIGQRKSETELRLREGEVNILGGLTNSQDSRLISGIPGIVNIPVLGRFFGSENVEKNQAELLIALVPHIVRTPGYSPDNLRAVYAGTDQQVRVSFAQKPEQLTPPSAPATVPPKPVTAPPASTAPAATPPPSTPSGIVLNFSPGGEIQAAPGSILTLALQASNVQDLFAVNPIRIKFDASKLKLNDVTQGDLMGRDGQRVLLSKDIRNDSGEATITLSRLPGAAPINGSGALLQLVFQGMGRGPVQVVVEEIAMKNSQQQSVAAAVPQPVTIRLQ